MRTIFLLSAALSSVFILCVFPGCKKRKNAPPIVYKLKSRTSATDFQYYTYDSEGRILMDSLLNDKLVYSYYSGKVIVYEYPSNIYSQTIVTYYLDNRSLADTAVLVYTSSKDYYGYKFYYDQNNCLIKTIGYDSSNAITLVDSGIITDGNLTASVQFEGPTRIYYSTITLTYDQAHFNTIGNENLGMPFLGTSDRNVRTALRDSEGNTNEIDQYAYTYDANNRIASRTIIAAATSKNDTFTYY